MESNLTLSAYAANAAVSLPNQIGFQSRLLLVAPNPSTTATCTVSVTTLTQSIASSLAIQPQQVSGYFLSNSKFTIMSTLAHATLIRTFS